MSSVGLFTATEKLSLSFMMHEPEYWCSPKTANLKSGERLPEYCSITNQCEMLNIDYSQISELDLIPNITTVPCDQFDYTRDEYPETAVTQFNLVCGDKFWTLLSQSVHLFGLVIGSLVSGILSDKYGRKPIIICFAIVFLVCGTAVVFSFNIYMFNLFRWGAAATASSVYNVSYTYCSENSSGSWRNIVTLLFGMSVSFGFMSLPFISRLFPRWYDLQLIITLPIIILILLLCIPSFFSESPRWLSTKLYLEEAVELTAKETKTSKIEKQKMQDSYEPTDKTVSIQDLFKTPGIRNSTFTLLYIWLIYQIVYNFIIMNIKSMIPGNETMNIEILAVLDLLASLISFPILQYFDRRKPISVCMP